MSARSDAVHRVHLLRAVAARLRGGSWPSEHSPPIVRSWALELVAESASAGMRCSARAIVSGAEKRCMLHEDHVGEHLAFDGELDTVFWRTSTGGLA